MLVRPQPPDLAYPGGEAEITRFSEDRSPGSTPGQGTADASMVKRTSRGSAKSEFLVQIQVEALWPNPKRQRDPAVNRGCVGSTPTGHPAICRRSSTGRAPLS